MALLLIMIAALAINPSRPDPTDLALGLAFTVLGLQAARNLALSAIVLGVVTARYVPGALAGRAITREPAGSPLRGSSHRRRYSGRRAWWWRSQVSPSWSRWTSLARTGLATSSEVEYPLASLEALDRPGVRVFSFDFWAGYLIDRSWPDVRVYHDTRVDLYGETQTVRYARAIAGLPGWDETLEGSCTTHVLVRPGRDPLAETLRLTDDWRVEFEEELAVTFVRAEPAPGCEDVPIP